MFADKADPEDRLNVNLPDGTPRRLTTQNIGEYYPTWSPDGNHIAFVTWDDQQGHIDGFDPGVINVTALAPNRLRVQGVSPGVKPGPSVKMVTMPFKAKLRMRAGPAMPAASPVSTKMPAPIIAPTPIMVMSKSERSRRRLICVEPVSLACVGLSCIMMR